MNGDCWQLLLLCAPLGGKGVSVATSKIVACQIPALSLIAMDVHLYTENIPRSVVLVRSGNQKLTSCTASSCCWNDQKSEISA